MSATAEMLYMTERRSRMLQEFADGNYIGLMDVIYEIAEEDLEFNKASMTKLLDDRDGNKKALDLLMAI
jgi:hypothetical protein